MGFAFHESAFLKGQSKDADWLWSHPGPFITGICKSFTVTSGLCCRNGRSSLGRYKPRLPMLCPIEMTKMWLRPRGGAEERMVVDRESTEAARINAHYLLFSLRERAGNPVP